MENFADFDNAVSLNAKQPVDENGKPLERWAPLGANDSPDLSADENVSLSDNALTPKPQKATGEQEVLNTSLLSLTSHFAQVSTFDQF